MKNLLFDRLERQKSAWKYGNGPKMQLSNVSRNQILEEKLNQFWQKKVRGREARFGIVSFSGSGERARPGEGPVTRSGSLGETAGVSSRGRVRLGRRPAAAKDKKI